MFGNFEGSWLFSVLLCLFSVSPDRQEQLHELLACEARYKWADMSKVSNTYKGTHRRILCMMQRSVPVPHSRQVLCQFDTDSQGWIHKNSLREFLFTYALPMRSDEFDQLWLR